MTPNAKREAESYLKAAVSVSEGRVLRWQWIYHFVAWYNEENGHSGIKYVSPMARHHGGDRQILSHREHVYQTARPANPARCQGRRTRIWSQVERV